ncbi:hypothetical protein MA16_Dca001898 [Dendrobium catenatum]|uniref:Uncharacterized protein n=1 Tax=Dendrobium catenatum TaxID=906689 RepID=A0A2I0XDR3_9ASPA|nr:hypothetical protein MA16_Dca001898 [Dendrobium catenatum]
MVIFSTSLTNTFDLYYKPLAILYSHTTPISPLALASEFILSASISTTPLLGKNPNSYSSASDIVTALSKPKLPRATVSLPLTKIITFTSRKSPITLKELSTL